MKQRMFFSISMLLIACLGFVAADCSKCKKGDPGYPNCNCNPPPPPPPPSPTVERWSCLAVGSNTETHPDEGLWFYPYGTVQLELWSDGKWNLERPDDPEYHQGIYLINTYIDGGRLMTFIDLYNVFSDDTVLWRRHGVLYADRHDDHPPFPIPAHVIQTIDSLHLDPTIMRFLMWDPITIISVYEFYVKMQ